MEKIDNNINDIIEIEKNKYFNYSNISPNEFIFKNKKTGEYLYIDSDNNINDHDINDISKIDTLTYSLSIIFLMNNRVDMNIYDIVPYMKELRRKKLKKLFNL